MGYYLAAGKFPYAELAIRLAYNPYMGLYAFHTVQETAQFRFLDPINVTKVAYDYSLRTMYDELVDSNLTFADNLLFLVYRNQNYTVPFYDTTSVSNQTELDKIYFGGSLQSARYNKLGAKYIDGLNPTLMSYYTFVQQFLKGDYCLPPYNDYTDTSCLNLQTVSNRPPVIQCYVGIQPENCPEQANVEQDFVGFS